MKVLFGRLSLAWVATPSAGVWPCLAVLFVTLLVACESPEEKEARHFERGVALYEEGQDEKAMVEFRNVLRLNPKNADAIFQMGLIHERAERLKPAFAAFQQATLERPDLVAAQHKLATTALQLAVTELQPGLVDAASKAADAIEKAEPGNPDGLAIQAAVALINGETQAVLDLAKAALKKAPQHEEAVAMLAGAYSRLGEHERALKRVDEALAVAPKSKVLWQAKLALLENMGDIQALVQTYQELFALEPEAAGYRLTLARLYRDRGELEKAEAVLRQAIDDGLLTIETTSALVDLVYQHHGFAAAEDELKQLIALAPDGVDLRFRLAEIYAAAERSSDAEDTLEEIIEDAETTETVDDARAEIAQLRFAAGDVDGARELVEEITAANLDHPKANLIGGAILVREGNFNEAIRSARAALRRDPNLVPALRLLAQAQLGKGESDAAIDTLGRVVSLDLTDVRSAEQLSNLLTQREDYAAALKAWDHVVRIAPDSAHALRARAEIAIRQGNWSEAQANIQWLSELPDQQPTAVLLAGRLLMAQGHFEKAREAFAKAQATRPTASAPMIDLARSYFAEGDIDGALAYLEKRTQEQPADAAAFNIRGGLLLRRGHNLREAEAAFREAIRLRPEWLVPYRQFGRALVQNGDALKAVDVYRAALEQKPEDPDILLELAWAYEVADRFVEAIDTYERLLQLEPDLDIAANNYAALIADFRYEDSESLQRALNMAARFRTSDNAALLDTLGWLHYRKGDYPTAATFLERAIALGGDDPQLHYHLGMVLARGGQAERAIEELAKAVAGGADYPDLEEAKATLAALQTELAKQVSAD